MGRRRLYPPCPLWKNGWHNFGGRDSCACGFTVSVRLRGTSRFDTHTRDGRWTPPDILAISAVWPRVTEAKNFFGLVQRGVITLEQAEADIRMSVRHRDFLLGQAGDETLRRSIQAVFRAREQTWEAFQLLCAGEELEEKAVYTSDYSEVT